MAYSEESIKQATPEGFRFMGKLKDWDVSKAEHECAGLFINGGWSGASWNLRLTARNRPDTYFCVRERNADKYERQ